MVLFLLVLELDDQFFGQYKQSIDIFIHLRVLSRAWKKQEIWLLTTTRETWNLLIMGHIIILCLGTKKSSTSIFDLWPRLMSVQKGLTALDWWSLLI